MDRCARVLDGKREDDRFDTEERVGQRMKKDNLCPDHAIFRSTINKK